MSSAGLILRPMQDLGKPSLGNAPSNPASPLIAQPGTQLGSGGQPAGMQAVSASARRGAHGRGERRTNETAIIRLAKRLPSFIAALSGWRCRRRRTMQAGCG